MFFKKILYFLLLFFISCTSYPIINFDTIQEYESPKYFGKYYSQNNSIFGFEAFLIMSEDSVKVEVYRKVKGACFLIFNELLKPVFKEYSFGSRVFYYKGENCILYKSDNKIYLEFIEDGSEYFEFNGKTTINFNKIDELYAIKYKGVRDCLMETKDWFHKNDFSISDWTISNLYYPYKNEIIQIRDSLFSRYDFKSKIKNLSNDELLKLIDQIHDETLEIIRKKYKLLIYQ